MDTYFIDPALDEENRFLFALASYNAGPNRIRRLRNEAVAMGLDADVWFRNVGREPVQYVGNIYKYYLAYEQLQKREEERRRVVSETVPDGG